MSFKAITTVYSYRHPETRGVINNLLQKGFPHHVIMGGVLPTGALDRFDHPIAKKLLEHHKGSVPALGDFKWVYPTAGSEQGIMEAMSLLEFKATQRTHKYLDRISRSWFPFLRRSKIQKLIDTTRTWDGKEIFVIDKIYVLKGEYEGYKAVAETRCIKTVEVDQETDPKSLEPGYFFISNPSARDGNIIPNEYINAICNAGHQIFYDLAYLDSTYPHIFDVSHPNIFTVVVSFSKAYGLFYDRIGFTFSREPVDSLYGTKWFKSIFALMIAKAVTSELKAGELYAKYRHIQESIIADINAEHGLNMRPSDALLLGYITAEDAAKFGPTQLKMIEPFKRGNLYRFCLTPYYFERDPERNELFRKWYEYVLQEPETVTSEQMVMIEGLRKEWLGEGA